MNNCETKENLEKIIGVLGVCVGDSIESSVDPLRGIIKMLIFTFTIIIFLVVIMFGFITYNSSNIHLVKCNDSKNVKTVIKQKIKYLDAEDITTYNFLYTKNKGKEVCDFYKKYENGKHYFKTICRLRTTCDNE